MELGFIRTVATVDDPSACDVDQVARPGRTEEIMGGRRVIFLVFDFYVIKIFLAEQARARERTGLRSYRTNFEFIVGRTSRTESSNGSGGSANTVRTGTGIHQRCVHA